MNHSPVSVRPARRTSLPRRLLATWVECIALAAAGALAFAASPAAAATTVAFPGNAIIGFGHNFDGELGNGTISSVEPLPVQASLPRGTTVAQVAPGCAHSLALTSSGRVLAWGNNQSGQLGNGAVSDAVAAPALVHLPAGVRIVSVSGGCSFSLAVSSTGQLWSWGINSSGQLGNGTTGRPVTTPALVRLPAGVRIRTAAAGFAHALAVTTRGQVYAWGANANGQLGNGAAGPATGTPALVHLPTGVQVTTATAGELDSLAVTTRGRVLGWGSELSGALGDGHGTGFTAVPVPAQLPPSVRVRSVFAGCFHTLAVTTEGSMFGFGSNTNGELGIGRTGDEAIPVRILLPAGTRVISAGGGCLTSAAVTSRGQLLTWGLGGLLGDGSTENGPIPARVPLPARSSAVATGGSATGNFTLVLLRQPVR